MNVDKVWMREAAADAVCETHDWPTDGIALRLITAMRERHGKDGINVCVDCFTRAKQDAYAKRAARTS